MARNPERRKQDIEAELLEAEVEARQTENAARRFDITERRWALYWRSIFFAITVVLVGLTVYGYVAGDHTTLPFVTGPGVLVSAAVSFLAGQRSKEGPPS